MSLFNSRFIVHCFILPAIALSFSSHADDIALNFTGTIKAGVCTVNTTVLNVSLGKVGTETLGNIGDLSPAKSVPISLDCPDGGPDNATVTFSGTPASDSTLLAIDAESGAASGVAVRINNIDGTKINLGHASVAVPLTSGTNTFNYTAQYQSLVNRSEIVAGSANATAEFTIDYP